MIDIRLIREEADKVKKNLERRKDPGYIKLLEDAIRLDSEWRKDNVKVEQLRARRNSVSRDIAQKKKAGESADVLMREAAEIPKQIAAIEGDSKKLKQQLTKTLMKIPNLLHVSVPTGRDDEDNLVLRERGKRTKHKFPVISHPELLERLGMADFEQAAKIAGARFYYILGDLVRLDLALQMFALDHLAKKGFIAVQPPLMMRRELYEGVTDMDDFEDVLYKLDGEDLFLIATSEHPMAAMHADQAIDSKRLPLKYAGLSPCFRKEAGTHGKDTKGIFRVHHFNKVEQFVFCKAEDSWEIFEQLIKNGEEIFEALGLPYRVVNICTGDIGSLAAKKLDLEVWMPAQQTYREAISCSNCTDYQARRLNVKWTDGKTREYVHTINSTAIATSRALVAILENFQDKDGSVRIPEALSPYLGGMKRLVADNGKE